MNLEWSFDKARNFERELCFRACYEKQEISNLIGRTEEVDFKKGRMNSLPRR